MEKKKTSKAVIIVPYANIRKQPDLKSEIKKIMKAGESVNVIEKAGDFYKLTIGYIKSDLIAFIPEEAEEE